MIRMLSGTCIQEIDVTIGVNISNIDISIHTEYTRSLQVNNSAVDYMKFLLVKQLSRHSKLEEWKSKIHQMSR